MYRKIASITQHWRLHAPCVLCHQFHRGRFAVCADCDTLLTKLINPCQYCAMELNDGQFNTCGNCIKKQPYFDQVMACYHFSEPLRSLLHDFKYQQALYLRSYLAKLILDALPLSNYQPDCLIPVPLHSKRIRQRGFNQAAELTKLLAKQLNLPFSLSLCEKVINTVQQVGLDGEARRKNLRNSFRVHSCPYNHVVLIDDLITTGSTANELARQLKRQGAQRVDVWCCARA